MLYNLEFRTIVDVWFISAIDIQLNATIYEI